MLHFICHCKSTGDENNMQKAADFGIVADDCVFVPRKCSTGRSPVTILKEIDSIKGRGILENSKSKFRIKLTFNSIVFQNQFSKICRPTLPRESN